MISLENVGLARISKNICQLQMVIAKLKNMAMTLLMIHKIHIDLFHVQKLNADIMFSGRYKMADILIRGMEIPRQGLKVVAIHSNGHVYADTSDPGFLNKIADVIELPEHGDLIDRSEALSMPFANGKYDYENANEHFIYGCETYKEWLEQLPVIIPASEEGSE